MMDQPDGSTKNKLKITYALKTTTEGVFIHINRMEAVIIPRKC